MFPLALRALVSDLLEMGYRVSAKINIASSEVLLNRVQADTVVAGLAEQKDHDLPKVNLFQNHLQK